jgi:hypothetical protein
VPLTARPRTRRGRHLLAATFELAYLGAGGAILALGDRVAGGGWLALRLAHVHLNVLGWVGLAVVGTEFTLWPTVLRARMVPGVERAVRWSLPPLAAGLAASRRVVELDGRLAGLVPAVAAGFALQTLTGALPTCCRWCSAAAPSATAASPPCSSWAGRRGWPPSTSGCWP